MAGEAYALAEWAPVAAEGVTTPSRNKTAWARNLAAPVRDFLSTETGGAVVLLAATVAALVWANSPWSDSYESVWTTTLSIQLGDAGIAIDLRHWVNEGLMTFFFLVVGLEAKRELDLGELRERRRLAIPRGRRARRAWRVPVAIYLAFNAGGAGAHGWGAAMSTDTAFALGVLALVAPRPATRLRVFLLTLAVVDDLVRAARDRHRLHRARRRSRRCWSRSACSRCCSRCCGSRRSPGAGDGRARPGRRRSGSRCSSRASTRSSPASPSAWSRAPTRPPASDLERVTELTRSFREQPTPELARSAQLGVAVGDLAQRAAPVPAAPVDELRDRAAVRARQRRHPHRRRRCSRDAVTSPITLGIVVGYVVGKPRRASCARPGWPRAGGCGGLRAAAQLAGDSRRGGAVAGIGFTVSLLIASIAFDGQQLDEAKLGVLAAARARVAADAGPCSA